MTGPSTHFKDGDNGSIHKSKQSATQSNDSWSRVSADHHNDGSITGVHVTSQNSDGSQNIIDIPTISSNVGDWYGNDTGGGESSTTE